jgi:hypothetical protein
MESSLRLFQQGFALDLINLPEVDFDLCAVPWQKNPSEISQKIN